MPDCNHRFTDDASGKRRLIEVLTKSSMLNGVQGDAAEALANVATICTFKSGEKVLVEGNDEDDLYILLQGEVAILVDGIEVNRRSAACADHIGEMSLIDPAARRSATVNALDNVVAAKIPEGEFTVIAEEYPRLWRNLAVELAKRIRQRNEHTKSTKQGARVSSLSTDWKQVVDVLENLPDALNRWTWENNPKTSTGEVRKWHIDNEYHVQNLLYTVLGALYPNIKDEEYAPGIGHIHPRLDIFIPVLNLIVEVKFLRDRDSFGKIERELAEDATLYRSGSHRKDTKLVAFLWDDSARNQEHAKFKTAIRSMDGFDDVVVVSRPGSFLI